MKVLFRLINLSICRYFKKKHTYKKLKILKPQMYDLFKKNGEGFYYTSIINKNKTNLVTRAISFFTGGKSIVHSMIMVYSENIKSLFTSEQWGRLEKKWQYYYGEEYNINDTDLKILILGSADQDGINYFNFSNYDERTQIIRKIPNQLITKIEKLILLDYLCSQYMMEEPYDYVGLLSWVLNKLFDDEYAHYCSELVYDAFDRIGIKISKEKDPSPAEINESRMEWIIFRND